MSKLGWIGVGLAVIAVGAIASDRIGSRPETPTGGPIAPCGPHPNCARGAIDLEAEPETVLEAARQALLEVDASDVVATDAGWTATSVIGPFTDDLEVAVEADGTGSTLWVRSASRSGRSDLGVNARRVDHVLEAVRRIAAESA
ncbi:DUF1499 domain-containing protein [Rubrivirga sp.]|uniref:DUF1499 domain-containing protein n=1 Tax=Rubrivirga sp. TaxID=1885344 RepID=UPI003C724EBB